MMDARRVALDLLGQVLRQRQALDQVLDRHDGMRALPVRDRRFCRMLVATTLRRLGQIDDMIARAEHRESEKSMALVNILRMGITQILFMDVPDHAAVDTSVRLADTAQLERQKGFVNGTLRTITRKGFEWLETQDAGRLNTPEWLLKSWIADYELRGAAEIAQANLNEAPLDITIRDEADRAYWRSHFNAVDIGAGTLRCESGGNVSEREGFDEGKWWVQDASAALPARLFGDLNGKKVLDLCAAPGGKTLQLAAQGAHVTALDRSAKRLKRVEENLERMRLSEHVEIVVADAAQWQPQEAPSAILIDAPCSATGTMRRNPDVAHLKRLSDMERLADVQARILANAYEMLAPGGVLIYCTCSLQKAEGEAQILNLFERYEDAHKLPITAQEIGGIEEAITEQGDVRLLPHHSAALGGMDGFFISRITKK